MISFIVRMRFEEADLESIRETLSSLSLASRQEPGCASYVAHFVADDAALEHHRNTLHFKQHAIGVLYQRMRDRQIENLSAVA